MTEILSHYHVNDQTMALVPAVHMDYDTIVLEHGRQLFVRQTPIQLIKAACIRGGAAYDGRRTAVSIQLGVKRKVPIPINPTKDIFVFPTGSPNAFTCHWIFYHHVKWIQAHRPSNKSNPTKSIISFEDGQQLPMNESAYLLEKQMQRTANCILRFTAFQNDRFTS